ncbi:hypothetical protein F4823DRAFT_603552 [Ustulina deusta]|nr:hypothetical protein F4823DRAFT_603552 [Ustulina deusta]
MRLLHVKEKKLKDFFTRDIPNYAILSHCWRHGPNEILYEDIEYLEPKIWQDKKKGAAEKVLRACAEADKLGYEYIWIDTCCIDKRSSSELSEAINSMFLWYRNSGKCIAFLDDINGLDELGSSRWFKRGWTLQELIAPDNVWFYNKDWSFIGDRFSMAKELSTITRIDDVVLRHGHEPELANWDDHSYRGDEIGVYGCYCGISTYDPDTLRSLLETFSIASIMSWAAYRETSREEDIAYCLMGLFDVNMPLLYGEKGKAFIRLQEEIIRRTNDQSILAWVSTKNEGMMWFLVRDLASSPNDFSHVQIKKKWSLQDPIYDDSSRRHMSVTKEGIEVDLLCFHVGKENVFTEEECYLGVLDCMVGDNALAKPALVIEKPPWSTNVFDRYLCFMLVMITPGASGSPDTSVRKGKAEFAANTWEDDENSSFSRYEQEFDMSNGEIKRITLARTLLRRGAQSRNRFTTPPLRIRKIVDCDAGEYAVDYALPDFDKVGNVALPSNEYYGLALLTKQGSPQFFVAWGHGYTGGNNGDVWCKVLPVDERVKKSFASAKEWGRRRRLERTNLQKHMLGNDMMSEEALKGARNVDTTVLDFGEFSREVVAELKRSSFLGGAFVDLTIHVRLPPEED